VTNARPDAAAAQEVPEVGQSVGLLIPSRGRPGRASMAATAAAERATLPGTHVYVLSDGDLDARYGDIQGAAGGRVSMFYYALHTGMVPTLNHYALTAATAHTHIGYCGDDHLVHTVGWDAALAQAAGPWGLAYGDDLHQGAQLPTAVVIGSPVVRALGFMAPPALRHLYVDNFWLALGQAMQSIRYVPQVIIEHQHPDAGKAKVDAGYAAVNSAQAYRRDAAAWAVYRAHRLPGDVAALEEALEEAVREEVRAAGRGAGGGDA
jgi:hypothetical protein